MQKSLLIIDADQEIADLVRACFLDCRTTLAANTEAGLSLARRAIFDLYLINDSLPDGTGPGLCKQLRSFDRNTPIIVLFKGSPDDRHQAAVDAGANACIDKLDGLSRLGDTVVLLLRWAEDISLNSRIAEIAAIRDSIEEELIELDGRAAVSNSNAQLARIRLMNVLAGRQEVTEKAYRAFIAAGGTKAYFDRWWPTVLNEVI
jgi:DNA-binding response OmpR family regulator